MFNLMNKRLNKKGFTLIELIVVIAIIAILAVILIPRFSGFTDSANGKAAVSDARNILVSIQAMEAEGKTSYALTDINTYAGTSFTGTLSTYTANSGDFTYSITKSGKTYTVVVTDYVLSATPTVSPT
jgi:type IV pilus assembly protein PilA